MQLRQQDSVAITMREAITPWPRTSSLSVDLTEVFDPRRCPPFPVRPAPAIT
jgi:hypothetical protein